MSNAALRTATDASPVSLAHAFIRRTDLSFANLERANLTRADLTAAVARGANFKDAVMNGTILRGTDLTGARNLTLEQLARAVLDETTVLPDYIDREALADLQANRKAP